MERRAWLVGATVCALGAVSTSAGTGQEPAGPADLVVVNANVLTVDGRFSRAQAVAIRDGVFTAVGTNAEIRKLVETGYGDAERILREKRADLN